MSQIAVVSRLVLDADATCPICSGPVDMFQIVFASGTELLAGDVFVRICTACERFDIEQEQEGE